MKKWELQESSKPVKQRKPIPPKPAELDAVLIQHLFVQLLSKAKPTAAELDAYNNDAFHLHSENALVPCPNCNRRFLPDSLVVHLRSCKGDGTKESPDAKKGPASRPRGIICYICGKEYGTASIDIHLKTCKKKWEDEESKKDKKDRRPLPQPPKQFEEIKAKGMTLKQKDIDNLNEENFKHFNEESRVQCPFCPRKFLPDRLEVHLRSCGKGKEKPETKSATMTPQVKGKGIKEANSSASKIVQRPKALVCYICGKEYGTHSLEIHLKTCKKKWEEQESSKPVDKRMPVPEAPEALQEVILHNSKKIGIIKRVSKWL